MFWFSIELTSVTNIWRGHRSQCLSQRRGIVILEVSPSREVRKYCATTSCRSVGAGSGPAPEIAPTDPQTPAGISEGSTKPVLQVQLGFLWNICQLSASHVWHLQYNASFKPRKALKHTFFAQHTWSICIGKGAKPHFTVIPLTDQIFFSDLLGVLYHQQLQRLFLQ